MEQKTRSGGAAAGKRFPGRAQAEALQLLGEMIGGLMLALGGRTSVLQASKRPDGLLVLLPLRTHFVFRLALRLLTLQTLE